MFSEKLENNLSSIDLISNFKIEMFNNKEIIYKIIFNGNPNKLLDIMYLYDFKIDASNDICKGIEVLLSRQLTMSEITRKFEIEFH